MLTISVITATYNRAHTIRDTLRSVNAQTYGAVDHVIIDGASKDDTVAIVKAEGRRVTTLVSERDGGLYDAFNKGLDHAVGDVIGYLNSDDFYACDTVLEEVAAAFADPEVEGVHADLVYVDAANPNQVRRHWRGRDLTTEDFRRGFIPAHPTTFLRRSVFDRIGRFNLAYPLAADYDLLLRAFYAERIKAVYVPRIWVRMRTGGATGGSPISIKQQNDEIRASREAHGLRYPDSLFFARKAIDRSLQMARAPFVRVPQRADVP
jgi:glycosyltransferase involved in cell wall biosynthesis